MIWFSTTYLFPKHSFSPFFFSTAKWHSHRSDGPGPGDVCTLREDDDKEWRKLYQKREDSSKVWSGAKCLADEKASAKLHRGDGSPEFLPAWNKVSWTSILLFWFSNEVKVTPGGNLNSQISQVLFMFNQGGSRGLKVVPPIRVIMGFTESKSTWTLEEATQKWCQGLERIWSGHPQCPLPLPMCIEGGTSKYLLK